MVYCVCVHELKRKGNAKDINTRQNCMSKDLSCNKTKIRVYCKLVGKARMEMVGTSGKNARQQMDSESATD